MERCGAGAVVLQSLFQEPIHPVAALETRYADEITTAKRNLRIPVIASINAATSSGWDRLARLVEQAGADAVELNAYRITLDPEIPSEQIEKSYVDIVRSVAAAVKIPVAIKLPPFFTNIARITAQSATAGARGIVLFNRIYQPDLGLIEMGPRRSLRLSTPAENRLPLQWISLLSNYVKADLAASTGIHSGHEVLKMILVGASTTQLCSILMKRGIPWLQALEQELREAMDICNITSLKSARGILARHPNELPGEVEREQYDLALQGYSHLEPPDWREEIPVHVDPHSPGRFTHEPLATQH